MDTFNDSDAANAAGFPFEWTGPAILLVDLDAFFASVEQLDHPGWRGKPVIVGGSPDKRGVVSTASYEARAYGVHSAMPSSQARRLCPDAIWSPGHFDRYRAMSNQVMAIIHDETPHVQQVSIDEAFCDVTPTRVNRENPVDVARRIQRRVEELGVTCSIGVATAKSIAKIASDMDKPRGLTVVPPGSERAFLDPLPVRTLSGVGAAAEAKLHRFGIDTLGDLAHADDQTLRNLLGKWGGVLKARARGEEPAEVEEDDTVKSVSNEMSFADDLTERCDIEAAIATMAARVGRRLRRKGLKGSTVTLKLRFGDRSVHSAQRSLAAPTDDELAFAPVLVELLDGIWAPGTPIRLVGAAVSRFDGDRGVQQTLFDADEEGLAPETGKPRLLSEDKRRELLRATDLVRDRFGEGAVSFGREIRTKGLTTGSSAKNPADYK